MIRALLLLPLVCLVSISVADAQREEGHIAPQMAFERILENGRSAKLELRGKAIVLDFWATWCSPCVAAIPKFNRLAVEFKDRPVVFLSVTDEPEEVVRKFLEKHPIEGFVAIDLDGSVFQQHNVKGRPFTVLIDRSGRIAAITDTYSLNKAAIEDLLKQSESQRAAGAK
ncbi:MAG TPA: TlpA disulfide reductase family protein [Thermoanaerobaculia bacterium]|nr:TlpA disulfide reductase family protein [Thermoanaerobaculia bacterium]